MSKIPDNHIGKSGGFSSPRLKTDLGKHRETDEIIASPYRVQVHAGGRIRTRIFWRWIDLMRLVNRVYVEIKNPKITLRKYGVLLRFICGMDDV